MSDRNDEMIFELPKVCPMQLGLLTNSGHATLALNSSNLGPRSRGSVKLAPANPKHCSEDPTRCCRVALTARTERLACL